MDVLTIADDLHARGVGVRILTGKLSGSYSPAGEGKYARPGSSATPATTSWSCGWAACPLGELGVNGADVREDGSSHR
jgi:hypothetical protein